MFLCLLKFALFSSIFKFITLKILLKNLYFLSDFTIKLKKKNKKIERKIPDKKQVKIAKIGDIVFPFKIVLFSAKERATLPSKNGNRAIRKTANHTIFWKFSAKKVLIISIKNYMTNAYK